METGGDNQPQPDIAPGGVQEAKESLDDKIARVKCVDFFTEWKKCISAYNQFHHYYIHGEYKTCKEEKERMYNCFKWRGTGKEKFKVAITTSLDDEQKNMHTPEPVWKLRDSPPSDWTSS